MISSKKTASFFLLLGSILVFDAQWHLANTEKKSASDLRGHSTYSLWNDNTKISISSSQLNYEEGSDIPIEIEIKNLGRRPFSFSLLDDKNFKLILKNELHETIAAKSPVILNKKRQVVLGKNESFQKNIDIRKYFALKPGIYYLNIHFYPRPNDTLKWASHNTLDFEIYPRMENPFVYEENIPATSTTAQGKVSISPEEIIYLFLSAEIANRWDNYFKYLRLNTFINQYAGYGARYTEAPVAVKPKILQEFANFLQTHPSGLLQDFQIIRSIPRLYNEEGNVYAKSLTEVYVKETRKVGQYVREYEYKYSLEKIKDSNVWQVVDMKVKVL